MDKPQTKERPALITIICLLAFLSTIGALRNLLFAPWVKAVGAWFPFYFFLHASVVLAASTGLWKMKKWGVYLFILAIVCAQAVMLIAGFWGIISLILCSSLLAILLYYLPETD
jgi:hypothetical protein